MGPVHRLVELCAAGLRPAPTPRWPPHDPPALAQSSGNALSLRFPQPLLSKADPAYNNQAIIDPYSNWRGPIWINANFLCWLALRRYGFQAESRRLAVALAQILQQDIGQWGSMHEDYDAETGSGLAPTIEQSPNKKFAGFVGWNLLAQDMLQCELTSRHCLTLAIPANRQ